MARDANVVARLDKYGYGKNKTVAFSECIVPEEFQRKLGKRKWSTFTKALFGRVIIMEVDDAKIVVDGQHRISHAQRHAMVSGPSIVYENGTMEDAAAMFDLLNSERVALRPADAFRAACVGGDQGMRDLDAALLDRGLDGWCQGRSNHDLPSIGSLVVLYEQEADRRNSQERGLAHTLYTLDVIAGCWSLEVPGNPHVRCIRGFGQFLRSEKYVTLKNGRRTHRKWNDNDRELLTTYIAATFPNITEPDGTINPVGLVGFLMLAQQKSVGGGGGGGSRGMELVLGDCLRKAKRLARG